MGVNLVAIPAANRPEMLALCLQSLDAARSRPEVHIYADAVPESRLDEIEFVRDLYLPDAFLFHARPHPRVPSGSWNILNSIKSAAEFGEHVFLVEEDTVVSPEFFEWHLAQDADVSCGRLDVSVRRRQNQYTNPGSFLRRPLLDALLPRISDEYFADQQGYCERLGSHHGFLDDGLIRSVIDKHGFRVKVADPAVCRHIGFRMYNHAAPFMNEGITIEEKILELKRILVLVGKLSRSDRYRYLYES